MRIEVEGLLGIRAAAVDLEPGEVVEVIGPNASGKTSLAVCAQALLAYDANPLGLGAGESRASYLLDGEGEGKATLADGDGAPYATWRPGSQTMEAPTGGTRAKPISRPEAAGIVDFTARRSARERAGLFHSSLLPPEAEVIAKLKELLSKFMDRRRSHVGVLAVVEERGYAAAEAIYTDRAREAKRSWTRDHVAAVRREGRGRLEAGRLARRLRFALGIGGGGCGRDGARRARGGPPGTGDQRGRDGGGGESGGGDPCARRRRRWSSRKHRGRPMRRIEVAVADHATAERACRMTFDAKLQAASRESADAPGASALPALWCRGGGGVGQRHSGMVQRVTPRDWRRTRRR